MMINLAQTERRIQQLADLIHAPASTLPTYGYSKQDGTPHIEVNELAYYYVNLDRDTKTFDRKTSDLDVLLYWVFIDVTSVMASYYAKAHRDPKINSRRIRFEHQLTLLEVINHDWKQRREQEIAEILKDSPYRDLSLN
jgi:immunity protein 63 of polymorphic toxin system